MFEKLGQMTLFVLTLLMVILIARSSPAQPDNRSRVSLTAAEQAWLQDHPTIRLGVHADYPPFEFMGQDGAYLGITSDMVSLVNSLLGTRMTAKPGPTWPQVLEQARVRMIDVVPCLSRTADREEFLLFTAPYINIPGVLVTRTDAPYVGGLDDLSGKTVAAVQGYQIHERLRADYPNMPLLVVNSPKEALLAVSEGKAFAFPFQLIAVHYWSPRLGLSNLKVAAPIPYSTPLCFGVRKDWPELVSILNKAIAVISPEERTNISQTWMSLANFYGITYEDLWKWAGPVCILVALLTLWNFQVRRQKKIIKEGADKLELAFAESNRLLAEAAHYVKALLPDPVDKAGIAVDWRFEPSAALGGDCFGYYWLDDDRLVFYLLDVAGHGVSASLLAVAVINVLRSQTLKNTDFRAPGHVLSSLNNAFPMDEQDEMYFTIWYGLYNRSSRTLSYASGGHPPAILLTSGNDGSANIVNLKTPNLFLGGLPGIEYEAASVTLSQPCNLYVFSDGAFEIDDGKGSIWGLQNFQEFLASSFARREPVLDRLMNYVSALKQGKSLDDDFSIVEIHFD